MRRMTLPHNQAPIAADSADGAAARIALLEDENRRLKDQLDWFKRQIFGRKSEQQILLSPDQKILFPRNPEAEAALAEQDPGKTISEHRRRTHRSGDEVNDTGLRFDETVPQSIIDVPAPELQGDEADRYEVIGFKENARLAQLRSIFHVLIYRRPILRHRDEQTLTVPAAPESVLEGSYADVSLLAGLLVDKAVYHLPLYRQHQRMLNSGVELSRSTLLNYMTRSLDLLEPIYNAQWRSVLDSAVVAMDEVPMKAGRKTPGKMKQTYFWPIYGDNDEIVFTWSAGRSHRHAVEQLDGFNGVLLTDGYDGYVRALTKLNAGDQQIIHANCWAHGRRGFERALKMEPDLAQQALDTIADLYQIEAAIRAREFDPDGVAVWRQTHSAPIVDAFFYWVAEQRQDPGLLPSNPLSKALAYVADREAELRVFLVNGAVQIDTNHLERGLRVIPLGRKNHLFCWSELGAKQLGMLQSLMVTCKLHGINPYDYLVDVLQRVSRHPARDVAALTPRLWKQRFADSPLRSDVMRCLNG
jgi:transposase